MLHLMRVVENTATGTMLQFTGKTYNSRAECDRDIRQNQDNHKPGVYTLYEKRPYFKVAERPKQLSITDITEE